MSNANYCASAITQRRQNKAIAGSFINRIQNGSQSTTSYGPLAGNFDQSVVRSVQEGQMTQYSKIAGTCTTVDPGCPCGVSAIVSAPDTPQPCVLTNVWATRFGGTDSDIGYGIAVGACGDTYVVGTWLSLAMGFYSFSQSPVGGGTIGTQLFGTMNKVNTNANEICYVAKLNSSGVVQWATKIELSGTSLGAAPGYAIALDSNENVYITGTYDRDITIYEGTLGGTAWGTLAKTSSGITPSIVDAFLVKYNSNGQVQWATCVGGAGSSTQSLGIAIGNDQIYLAGYFNATIGIYSYTSGGGGGSAVTTTSIGTMSPSSIDAMVVKYNTSGVAQWATKIGGTSTEIGLAIAADSTGNAYVTGYYQSNPITIYNAGTSPFGNVATLPTIANANPGTQQAYVVKYDGTGVRQWATRMGGTGQYGGNAIAADALGNVYVTGVFSQTINLYNAPGTSFGANFMTNTNPGTNDAFVVKFDSVGQVAWGTKIGGTIGNEESGEAIAVDTNGNVYVTGHFLSNPATVFSAPLGTTSSFTLTNQGSRDVFLVKYNLSGTAVWATSMGGSAEDRGQAIALDSLANVYVTGQYASNPITFYNAPSFLPTAYGTLALIGGSADTFVVKYNTNGQIQ